MGPPAFNPRKKRSISAGRQIEDEELEEAALMIPSDSKMVYGGFLGNTSAIANLAAMNQTIMTEKTQSPNQVQWYEIINEFFELSSIQQKEDLMALKLQRFLKALKRQRLKKKFLR